MENLNLAFDIAEKYLDIPRMLDPEGNILHFLLTLYNLHLSGYIIQSENYKFLITIIEMIDFLSGDHPVKLELSDFTPVQASILRC